MLRPGQSMHRSAHPFGRPINTSFKAIRASNRRRTGRGAAPTMEKMAGEVRDSDATAVPQSRRRRGLAAVEAAEQAMELRVGG
jgi:hypothetical protein